MTRPSGAYPQVRRRLRALRNARLSLVPRDVGKDLFVFGDFLDRIDLGFRVLLLKHVEHWFGKFLETDLPGRLQDFSSP